MSNEWYIPYNLNRIVDFNNRLLFRLSELMYDMKNKRGGERNSMLNVYFIRCSFTSCHSLLLLFCLFFTATITIAAKIPPFKRALQLISRVIFPSSSLSPSSFLRCVDVISIYLNIHFRCTLNFQIFFLLYKQTLLYCCCCFLFLCVCALYAQYRPISCSHHWLLIPNHPICAFHYSNTISKDIYMNTFVLPTFIVVVIGATKVCQ